jgi:hypothetical protein
MEAGEMEIKNTLRPRACALILTLLVCGPALAQKAQITGRVADASEA